MAWNPSPEVAAVRDAASKVGSPFAVLIWIDESGKHINMASYGKTMALCREAGKWGDYLMEASKKWGEPQ